MCEGTPSERDIFFFHENKGGFLQTWEPLLEGVVSSSVLGGGVQECWEPLSRIVFGSSAEKRGVGSLATIWDSIPP